MIGRGRGGWWGGGWGGGGRCWGGEKGWGGIGKRFRVGNKCTVKGGVHLMLTGLQNNYIDGYI